MRKNIIISAALGAAAVTGLAGCGTTTVVVQSDPNAKVYASAQELAGEVSESLTKVNSFSFDEYFNIDANLTMYGQSTDMKQKGTGSGEMQIEPEYAHLNLDLTSSSAGTSATQKSESYISGSGSDLRAYIKTDGSSWIKDTSATGIEFGALMEQFLGKSIIESVNSGEISANIENNGGQVNGKDAYKISAKVPGNLAGASLSDALGAMQTATGDWSGLTADMDIYIYKDELLPAKISINGSEFLEGVMEQMGIDCKVKEYVGEYTINDYKTSATETLTIPDSVILEAGDSLPTSETAVQTAANEGSLSKKDTETTSASAVNDTESKKSWCLLPDSSSRLLTESDLSGFSDDELRKARNEIFARHGRRFKDSELQNYFEGFSWYTPSIEPDEFDVNVEKYLSDIEIKNVDFLKKTEDKENSENVAYSDKELKRMALSHFKSEHGSKTDAAQIDVELTAYEYNGDGHDIIYKEIYSVLKKQGGDIVQIDFYRDESDKNTALDYSYLQWIYYINRSTGKGKQYNWMDELVSDVDLTGY